MLMKRYITEIHDFFSECVFGHNHFLLKEVQPLLLSSESFLLF